MKRIFTLLSVIVLSMAASAQYYQLPFINAGENPGGLNTDAAQPSSNPLLGSGETDWSAGQTIPFSFDFNGTSYSTVYIAPSGIVTFTSVSGAAPTGGNVAIPSATIPDNSICLWGLNLSGGNDGVEVNEYGSAPNRQYWISWKSASWDNFPGGSSWAYWSIVLEETSNRIYLVDERNLASSGAGPELTAGLQFSSSAAMSVPGSPALTATNLATGGSDAGPIDNSYYVFIPGAQPDYDVTMSDLDMPRYLKLGQGGTDVMGTITNFGAQTITDLELSYTVDNGTAVVANLTGLNIAPGASMVVTHPTTWDPTTEASFDIEFWASMVNGNVDADPSNDKTNGTVETYTTSYPRVVLYETFTSSTCAPCVAGNANFESVIATLPAGEVASIKYQMSWPGDGDPYNTVDGNDRRGYYNINSVPRLEADGGWDGNSSIFTAAVHDDAMEVPAFVEIDATYKVVVADQKVFSCATIVANRDLGDATLHVAIMENLTTANVGTNGETEFHNVVKKLAPDASGQTVNITDGMSTTICTDYTFNGDYRLPPNADADKIIDDAVEHSVEEFSDLSVVVWLQDDADPDKAVLNATNAVPEPVSTGGIDALKNTVSVFPNPAVNNATVSVNVQDVSVGTVKVMDVVGKTVINLANVQLSNGVNRIELNTGNLNGGVYMVEVTVGDEVTTSQLVIQK